MKKRSTPVPVTRASLGVPGDADERRRVQTRKQRSRPVAWTRADGAGDRTGSGSSRHAPDGERTLTAGSHEASRRSFSRRARLIVRCGFLACEETSCGNRSEGMMTSASKKEKTTWHMQMRCEPYPVFGEKAIVCLFVFESVRASELRRLDEMQNCTGSPHLSRLD